MQIAVVGAGAIGGVVAWHLAEAGAAPVIVARPASAERFRREGLTVIGPSGARTVTLAATSDAAALGACDVVLAGLKAHDWPQALPLIRPLLGPQTVVVPMLNGLPWWYFQGVEGPTAGRRLVAVDPDGVLSAAVPAASVLGCVIYMGASRDDRHHIVWNGSKRLLLGEPAGGESGRLRRIVEFLKSAGLNAEETPHIRKAVWHKILGNVAHNPLSVVTDATIGRLAAEPHLKAIMRTLMEEAAAVAAAYGVGGFDIEQRLQVTPAMAGLRTSMLQDFHAGRPLELAAIVDAVVELGRAAGVPTPVLATIGALALERWLSAHGSSGSIS